jgi:acyl-CoA synthetase (AMP-forming)/AMP-acid ligase II
VKDMIVTGGENVFPAEVENALMSHPGVADVAVVGVPDDIYGERVLAAVVPHGTVDLDDLRTAVASNLTAYKVPSEYVIVDSIPVNSTTGKVDRRSLVTLLLAMSSEEERA